jgi:hypothetical protein
MLGQPASHGCIRLSPTNAKTFYGLVGKHGKALTKVVVHGTPKWRAPAVASRRQPRYGIYETPRYSAYRPSGQFIYPGDYAYYDDGYTYRPRKYYKPRRAAKRYYLPPRYGYGYGYGNGGW